MSIADEIKKALENISGETWAADDVNGTIWNDEGRAIFRYTADEEEGDIDLIANAPEWLRWQQGELEYSKQMYDQVYDDRERMRAELDRVKRELAEKDKVLLDIKYQIEQSDHPAGIGILASVNTILSQYKKGDTKDAKTPQEPQETS